MTAQVVWYIESGRRTRWGIVTRVASRRLEIVDKQNRTRTIPESKVLIRFEHPGDEPAEIVLQDLEQTIEELTHEIDLELLWRTVVDDPREYSLGELVRIYFGENELPIYLVALWSLLRKEPAYFRPLGNKYCPRPPEHVVKILHQRQTIAKRNAKVQALSRDLRALLQGSAGILQDTYRETAALYIEWLRHRLDPAEAEVMARAVETIPELKESPLSLVPALQSLGFVQDDLELFLLYHGIDIGFRPEALEQADHISPFMGTPEAIPDRSCLVSIDDAETREVDDALGLVEHPDGSLEITVHITNASYFIKKDTVLDSIAEYRVATLYLPDRPIYMLPPRVSTEIASLIQGAPRPVITLRTRWTPDLILQYWTIEPTAIEVQKRLTYEEVNEILHNPQHSHHRALTLLHALAERLEAARNDSGALNLVRPEAKIHVSMDEGGEPVITVSLQDMDTQAHRIVREWMIFYNARVAEWARDKDITMIYRVQDPPEEPSDITPPPKKYDPVYFRKTVRKLRRSNLWPTPRHHWALGLDAYIQMSSPLRRYADLVTQRQLLYHLEKGKLLYSKETLLKILTAIEEKSLIFRDIEQQRHRYWLLKYLERRHSDEEYSATVLEEKPGGLYIIELDDFLLEGVLFHTEKLSPGENIKVRISSLNWEKLNYRAQFLSKTAIEERIS